MYILISSCLFVQSQQKQKYPQFFCLSFGGANFSCCFPEWQASIMSYTPRRFEGRACDPFDCNEDFKGWKTRTAGTFFIRIKKISVFFVCFAWIFWKTEAINKILGRWEIFGVIGNCVCFLRLYVKIYFYSFRIKIQQPISG